MKSRRRHSLQPTAKKAMRLNASGGDREWASYIPESARPDADHKIAVFLMGQANAIHTASTIARNAGEVLTVAEPSEVAIWHISAT